MSKKLRRAHSRAWIAPCLKVCSIGAFGVLGGTPAWAQVTQSGTPPPEDPTIDVDDAWREGLARKSDWTAVVGFGLRAAPDYPGADQMKVSPAPFAAISWKERITLDIRGLTVYPVKTSNFRLGFSVGYAPGRNEDRNEHLAGLGNIDAAFRSHALADYRIGLLTLGVDVSKDVGGSDGVQILFSATIRIPVTPRITVLGGVNATWADSRYTNTFFGVTSAQSITSGLPTYNAGAGFTRVDADLGLAWTLSPRLSARARVGIGRFVGDATSSPIIEKVTQPFVGLSLARRF